MKTISVKTNARSVFVDITADVASAVSDSGIADGTAIVFVPHTTAGVTINENADPDVQTDVLGHLDRAVPHSAGYLHMEGNSAAHVKASMMGSSVTVIISGGILVLGTWQGIYFAEFDGPRSRKVHIKIMEG